jgi:hypothetical protein
MANDYLSGQGDMVASGPINAWLKEGANEVSFTLSGADGDELWFLAALEVAVKDEIVDTTRPGGRLIFQRELSDAETVALLAGSEVTISETFDVSREALKRIKSDATPAPKSEPSPAH